MKQGQKSTEDKIDDVVASIWINKSAKRHSAVAALAVTAGLLLSPATAVALPGTVHENAGSVAVTLNAAAPSVDGRAHTQNDASDSYDAVSHHIELPWRGKRYLDVSDAKHAGQVVWTSDNEGVAKVDQQGVLVARSAGNTLVRATDTSGNELARFDVTVANRTYDAAYDTMKDRWLKRLVGTASADDPLDMNDSAVASYVSKLLDEGRSAWKTLHREANRKTLWDKKESDTASANLTSQMKKLKPLAIAWALPVPGNELYENREVFDEIIRAIDFIVNDLGFDGSDAWTDNWWDWQIGTPQRMVDVMMLVSDYVDPSVLKPAMNAIYQYCPNCSHQMHATNPNVIATGANRTDIAITVLGSAIINRDDARMELINKEVPEVMDLVAKGDGIYADGSVVQHSAVAYNGSYGNELIKGIGKISSIVAQTPFEMSDPRVNNVYNAVLYGYIPLMRNAQMMSMVNGRSIARVQEANPYSSEKYWGNETIANVLLMEQAAPEPYKSQFRSALKLWLGQAGDFYYRYARDFDAMLQARAIEGDANTAPSLYEGMHVYGSMDRVVQAQQSYAAALSMYSSRIYNYECMNSENQHGWHTGDGMLLIYNDDLAAFDDAFWATVDPYRLPGTTVDTRVLENGAATSKYSPAHWVGGVTNGRIGAAGMQLDTSNLKLGMDLSAKKSYFFLNGKIVALGADINGTSDAGIETTVENRIMAAGDARVAINGQQWHGTSDAVTLAAGDYVTLAGPKPGTGFGYYFLDGAPVSMAKEHRDGTYADINKTFPFEKPYSADYFKLGIKHGSSVNDGTYAYVVVPGADDAAMGAFAQDPGIEVVENSAKRQVVFDASAHVTMGNVWAAEGGVVGPVSVNGAASVLVDASKKGTITISVSDPTQIGGTLRLNVAGGQGLFGAAEGVRQIDASTFDIDFSGAQGASRTLSVAMPQDDGSGDMKPLEPAQPTPNAPSDAGTKSDGGSLPQTGDPTSASALLAAFFAVTAFAGGLIGKMKGERS